MSWTFGPRYLPLLGVAKQQTGNVKTALLVLSRGHYLRSVLQLAIGVTTETRCIVKPAAERHRLSGHLLFGIAPVFAETRLFQGPSQGSARWLRCTRGPSKTLLRTSNWFHADVVPRTPALISTCRYK